MSYCIRFCFCLVLAFSAQLPKVLTFKISPRPRVTLSSLYLSQASRLSKEFAAHLIFSLSVFRGDWRTGPTLKHLSLSPRATQDISPAASCFQLKSLKTVNVLRWPPRFLSGPDFVVESLCVCQKGGYNVIVVSDSVKNDKLRSRH